RFPIPTTQIRIAVLGLYSKTSGLAWGSMLASVWPKSFCWTNSQAEVSTNFGGLDEFRRPLELFNLSESPPMHPLQRTHDSSGDNPEGFPSAQSSAVQTSLGFLLFPLGEEKKLNNN